MFSWFPQFTYTKRWLRQNVTRPLHTPDLGLLENKRNHLVFEYGEVSHKVLEKEPLCSGYTVKKFVLWNKNQGKQTFPIALDVQVDGTETMRAHIRGVLYGVPTERLVSLDNFRQNGVSFKRRRMDIYTGHTDANGNPATIEAWVYVGITDHWLSEMEWNLAFYRNGGSTFTLTSSYVDNKPHITNYYHFTKQDHVTPTNIKCFIRLGLTKDVQQQPNPK